MDINTINIKKSVKELLDKTSIRGLISSLIIQFFIFQIFSMTSAFDANYLSLVRNINNIQSFIFSLFPFSVGDILYLALIILIIYLFVKGLKSYKKEGFFKNKYFVRLMFIINIFYFLFMILFGSLYFKYKSINYPSGNEKNSIEDMKIVASLLFNDCVDIRKQLDMGDDNVFEVKAKKIYEDVFKNQKDFIDNPLKIQNIKTSLFSFIFRKLGVLGYYNPFTAEANIVGNQPSTLKYFTVAHEIGHQIGITKENEANFFAFYMGESSVNKNYRYSVKLRALCYLLSDLNLSSPDFVQYIEKQLSNGMKKDIIAENNYRRGTNITGKKAFMMMNDAYLKSNKEKGVETYGYLTNMVVSYYKRAYPDNFR